MEIPFIITQSLFWKCVLFYTIIWFIIGFISLITQSISDYSWYGFKNYTFIGGIFVISNILWILLPLAFLVDFIHLITNWIF